MVAFLLSALAHAAVMILLALIVVASRPGNRWGSGLILSSSVDQPDLDVERMVSETPSIHTVRREESRVSLPPSPVPMVNPVSELPPTATSFDRIGDGSLRSADWGAMAYPPMGGGLEGRFDRAGRMGDGGSDESEAAVERGLWWLVAHQGEDGGWNFNHQGGNCKGLCRNPGDHTSTTAATAIALAPFLGAGYTHRDGVHKEAVRKGLYYLQTRAFETSNGIDLQEGTMYAQGLATIVLCEAYAMTKDDALKDVAQGALDFIEYAQGENGGWRYNPGEPGDTTVTGWQLMALKSGEMAGLRIKTPTMYRVNDFLDTVQSEEGAKYGYMDPVSRPATTAVGLLCRMYLRWLRSHAGLAAGIKYLDETGPSKNDMYFNYYATLVMHHWQGSEWKRWNDRMRDYLIQSQSSQGHENGSWYFEHEHSLKGGRLYNTAMTIMTLEVYYRYMPLYQDTWN
ncbi:MAG: prenyltransferase/squalene oxidase repeat-containing protein [Thermoguttaceae bacterium]